MTVNEWIVMAGLACFVLAAILLGWLSRSAKTTCRYCFYPFDRCECPKRCEHTWWPWRWSQDGWVRRCKECRSIQYGGDGVKPDERGHVQG